MNTFIYCKVCDKKLTGRQTMFCSRKCKNKIHQSYSAQKERAIERKLYFISALGGKCHECGYAENLAALSFHHKSGKEYKLDSRSLSNRDMQTMKEEIAKCDLLCSNCHAKLHNPSLDLAKLSIEPTALTTELQALKYATNSKEIIAKKHPIGKEFSCFLENLKLNPIQNVVLGVSGGIDSVVMLDLFAKHPNITRCHLVVAHLNHSFRAEADEDEEFVKSLAKRYGIKFVSKKLEPHKKHSHILQNMRMSSNLEEYFRDERRKFLLDVTRLQGADFLALAHHADDQAETVLMNLVRGSGPAGLAGMKVYDKNIIRPLLGCARSDILNYAVKNKLRWREDETNKDTTYSRNYIRHEILPLLTKLNPEYLANIGRTAGIQREIDTYLKGRANFLVRQLSEDVNVSKHVPQPILYEALGQMYEQVRGNRKDLSIAHLSAIENLINNSTGTKKLDLPGGVVVNRRYNHLDFVLKMRDNIAPVVTIDKLTLGSSIFGKWIVTIASPDTQESDSRPHEKDEWFIYLDSLEDLAIRTVGSGDKIQKKGLGGHKKLQDLFVDAKIDKSKRRKYPILTKKSTDEILWVPGLAVSELLTTEKAKYSINISEGHTDETSKEK